MIFQKVLSEFNKVSTTETVRHIMGVITADNDLELKKNKDDLVARKFHKFM